MRDAHTKIEKVKRFLSIESEWPVCPFNIFFYEIKIFVIDEIQFLPFSSRAERVRGTIINNDVCYQINITHLKFDCAVVGVSESVCISLDTLLVRKGERENNNIYQISIYTSSFLNSQTRLFFPHCHRN